MMEKKNSFPINSSSFSFSITDSPDRPSKLVGYQDRQCDPDHKEELHGGE